MGNEKFEASLREYKHWLARADAFSDEAFFDEILSLSDTPFKLIASRIRKPSPIEEEKGMRCSLLPDQIEQLEQDIQTLEEMGLVRCTQRELEFHQKLIADRLSQRQDLIQMLKDRLGQ